MACVYTFKQVRELIKKDEPALLGAVDKLLGMALICSPLALGPAVAAFLPTLAAKNELVKIGRELFDKFSKKKDADYLAKQQRMQAAYALLVFTAFFDALDQALPEPLRNKLTLFSSEQDYLVKTALAKTAHTPQEPPEAQNLYATMPLAFPHPTESLAEQSARHAKLWTEMGQGFQDFLFKLALWEQATDKEREAIISAIEKIPKIAAKRFEAHYFELACCHDDFAIWANLQEHKTTKAHIEQLSGFVRQYAELAQAGLSAIDIGFDKLHQTILSIPETLTISRAENIVESLNRHYQARMADTILKDEETQETDKPRLSFPRVCDAFIPQSFHVLRQTVPPCRFEDEATWRDLPRRDDLGAFLLSYLSSPYSTETPLVILGHPGSGKSLLTHVLSAQLMSSHYTAIRVPLREVDAEAKIIGQIEQRLRDITHLSVDSWAQLSGAFKNSPPIVILDGYDELLQASGKVFSGYLKDVQDFQKSEAEQGRPVRVIVTSRVTLIDKATIPNGSTLIRLLEFDQRQQDRWLNIWNTTNAHYFNAAKVEPFCLPDSKARGAEKILALAEQPLLLLMLALYDSQDNPLRKAESLDRTVLYNNLLRRFVTRELEKDKPFERGDAKEQAAALDTEMLRLGVAAIGMYNRRQLHVLSQQVNEDLAFFDLERKTPVATGKAMSQADLLLGSFFFVHQSETQHQAGALEQQGASTAFEFLHNTFGEFLSADFILHCVLDQVEVLRAYEANPRLLAQRDNFLNNADGLSRQWFAGLIYTPLFTRPVVLEMMREWVGHALNKNGLTKAAILPQLDTLILYQLQRLLSQRAMPPMLWQETVDEKYRANFGDYPLLGHIAIYSLNLILLRIIITDEPFIFDESKIDKHEDGTRPWDRLAHSWRSWFSLENLNGVTAVMIAERDGTCINIRAKATFQLDYSHDRLETCLGVAVALADNVTGGLSGLLLFNPAKYNLLPLQEIEARLESEQLNLSLQMTMQRLFQAESRITDDESAKDFIELVDLALHLALRNNRRQELEHIVLSLRRRLQQMSGRNSWCSLNINPTLALKVAISNPRAGLMLFQIAKVSFDEQWCYSFSRKFMKNIFVLDFSIEMLDRVSDLFLGWIELMQEISSDFSLKHFRQEFINPGFIGQMFDPNYLGELAEHRPETALIFLQLVKEMGDEDVAENLGEKLLNSNIFEQILNPRYLLELAMHKPESALAGLQLAREMGGKRLFQQIAEKNYLKFFETYTLNNSIFEHKPTAFVVLLALARITKSPRLFKAVTDSLMPGSSQMDTNNTLLASLPLSSLSDLKWWAETTGDADIKSALASLFH